MVDGRDLALDVEDRIAAARADRPARHAALLMQVERAAGPYVVSAFSNQPLEPLQAATDASACPAGR